jgi:hypothetical protein
MASGINIDIAANVRQFQKGTSDAEGALTELAEVLDDVAVDTQRSAEKSARALGSEYEDGARDAEKAVERMADKIGDATEDGVREAERAVEGLGDTLGDSTKEGVRDAEQSTERLEKSFKELADGVKRESKDMGDPMAISMKKGTADASEGVRDFKQEAKQNAEEVASSFDGSAASIGEGFQSVAATAFAGFGPAGMIAGLAAAAGLGLIFAQIEKNDERTQELREKVAELAGEYIEAGLDGRQSMSGIAEAIKDMALATEDGTTNLSDLRKMAKEAGVPFQDLAKAMAGDKDAIDQLLETTNKQIERQGDLITGSYDDTSMAASRRRDSLEEIRTKLEEVSTTTEEAAQIQRDYAAAGAEELAQKAELIENVDEAYDDAAGSVNDYVDAESGLFDPQAYIDSMLAKQQALKDYQQTLATSPLTPEAKAFLNSQGADSAATFLAGYKTATPAQQAELNRIWSEAGSTSSGAFSASTQANLNQAGYNADVALKVDDRELQNYIRRTSVSLGVNVRPVDGTYGAGLGFIKRQP